MSKKIGVARISSEARHTVTVKLTLEDEAGNVEQVDARVVYRGMSLRASAALRERLEEMDPRVQLVKGLAATVIALPDFVGGEGEAVEPSEEFFDTLDSVVLNKISDAIAEDRVPPTRRSGF
jgi:hypothetical protein